MTIIEVEKLLKDISKSKKRVRRINTQIEEYASIQSSLNQATGHGKGCVHSHVEAVVLRLEKERISLAQALDRMFSLEDKLSFAIEFLSPVEQDIIISYYMQDNAHWKIAAELGYCVRQVIRIKEKAIKKISNKI